jgi:hypothetical protein
MSQGHPVYEQRGTQLDGTGLWCLHDNLSRKRKQLSAKKRLVTLDSVLVLGKAVRFLYHAATGGLGPCSFLAVNVPFVYSDFFPENWLLKVFYYSSPDFLAGQLLKINNVVRKGLTDISKVIEFEVVEILNPILYFKIEIIKLNLHFICNKT